MRTIPSNRSVMAFNLIWLWERVDRLNALYDSMAAVLSDPPVVGREFPFSEAPAALRWLKSGESTGKVVLVSTRPPAGPGSAGSAGHSA